MRYPTGFFVPKILNIPRARPVAVVGSSERSLAAFLDVDLAEPRCDRTRSTRADRRAVDLHDRHHERGGGRNEGLVGRFRLVDREGPLLDLHLCLGSEAQYGGAGDAVENLVAEMAGHDLAVRHDIGVVRG